MDRMIDEQTINAKKRCCLGIHHKTTSIDQTSIEKLTTNEVNVVDDDGNDQKNGENNIDNKEEMMLSADFGVQRLPETEQELDQVNELLANEFNNLSVEERERVMFDIHGISQACDDNDPPNVDELLQQLDDEIEQIKDKEEYNLAKSLNPTYVTDRDFRRMFLRCEKFQPKPAAERIVTHFAVKKLFFGSPPSSTSQTNQQQNNNGKDLDNGKVHVLARPVLMSDLNEKDMEVLESGFIQILPERDTAGRIVFCISPKLMTEEDHDSVGRCCIYTMMSLLQDEEIQRKGLVIVEFNLGKDAVQQEYRMMRESYWMRKVIPDRVVAVHYCYNDPSLRPYVAGIQLLSLKDERERFRVHFGDEEETLFRLQTYGIDTSLLPTLFKKDGTVSVSWHREWIRIQRGKEELNAELASSKLSSPCLIPRRFDVIFGRTKQCRQHAGNLRAVHLVHMYSDQYEAATKYQKMVIADRIVSIVHESYGRFLKWDPDMGWVQVDSDTARDKISHYFRRHRSNIASQKASSSSSASPTCDSFSSSSSSSSSSTPALTKLSSASDSETHGSSSDDVSSVSSQTTDTTSSTSTTTANSRNSSEGRRNLKKRTSRSDDRTPPTILEIEASNPEQQTTTERTSNENV